MKPLTPKLLLLGASLIICLFMFEVALWILVGSPAVYRYPQESYVHDPAMGHRLVPGDRAFTHDRPVSINSYGLRGPEFEQVVPARTRRILALGDSQTFGNGLDLEETWPALLESKLHSIDPRRRWQVLNAGISATDTWQHAEWLDQLAELFDFDLVVLGFYVNDVTPRYVPPPAEEITNSISKRLGYWLKRSALFTLAWQLARQHSTTGEQIATRERDIIAGRTTPVAERGWEEVERSLHHMKRLCDRVDAPLLMVVIPRRDQVDGSEFGAAYARRAAVIAGRLGIPVVNALAPLRQAYQTHGSDLFIPWDGHNTRLANDVIARTLIEAYGDELLDLPSEEPVGRNVTPDGGPVE